MEASHTDDRPETSRLCLTYCSCHGFILVASSLATLATTEQLQSGNADTVSGSIGRGDAV